MSYRYSLLSVESDAKTSKGTAQGYLTAVLYLAPANEAGVGDMCPMSTPECRHACLYGAGMSSVFPSIKRARIRKTRLYVANKHAFVDMLRADIHTLVLESTARELVPAVRINGTSDLPKLAQQLAREFPDIQFYDYTKIGRVWKRKTANYHITFSFSGTNHQECIDALKHGVNVVVVFHGQLPPSWYGYPVINGDASDLRFLDPHGVIVGLKAKGQARKMETGGFVQLGGVA